MQWQPPRIKKDDVTVDDKIRPFSIELELANGDKVFCTVCEPVSQRSVLIVASLPIFAECQLPDACADAVPNPIDSRQDHGQAAEAKKRTQQGRCESQ